MKTGTTKISSREFTDAQLCELSKLCGQEGVYVRQEEIITKEKKPIGRKVRFKEGDYGIVLNIYDDGVINFMKRDPNGEPMKSNWQDSRLNTVPIVDFLRYQGFDFEYQKIWAESH